MAVEPLSLMYATAGVSSRALQLARHDAGPSGPTYQQKLTAIHTMMSKPTTASSSHPSTAAAAVTTGQTAPPGAMTVQLGKLLAGPSAQQPAAAGARSPGPRARVPCSSNQLSSSKLLQPESYTLASIDFAATADSSVGGGGLPRPYGRFTAARNGDGNAVWERLPPASSTVWPSKKAQQAQPNGPDVSGQEDDAPGTQLGSHRAPSSRSRYPLSALNSNMKAGKATRISSSSMAVPRTADVKVAPLPGPVTLKVGATLPSATFLTEVPPLPGNVRVDCGYSRTKDFLLSGLARVAHVPEAPSGSSWALTMQEPMEHLQHIAPDPSQAQSDGEERQGHRRALHAVTSTIEEQISETLMRGSLEAAPESPATGQSPVTHYILSTISDAHHSQPTTVGVAPDFATGRRVKNLPPEQALPRRHVPGVGR